MIDSIKAGATSQSVLLFLADSTSTTGGGKTGLVFNTAGLTAYYSFAGASATSTSITLATLATVGTAWSTGGFKEIDATNMPGIYRFDIPNAALAASSGREVTLYFQGATGLAPTPIKIELTGWDNQDAVHGGLTSLPNTACTTNASLLTSGTGTDQISVSAGKMLLQATQSGVTIPTVTTVTNQLTAAAIATGIWQDATAGDFTTSSSIGKSLYTSGIVPGAAGGHFISGTNTTTTVNFTGNLSGSVGSVTGLTTATIATAVWTDTTAGDFTTTSSPGKILVAQLGGTFTSSSSSVFSTASLANAAAGSGPTVAQIATGVWQDLLSSSDFSTVGSIGALLKADVSTTVTVGGYATGQDPATLVLNAPQSSYIASGSIGNSIAIAAGSTPTSINPFQFFLCFTGTNTGATGKIVTATRNIDGGGFAPCANSVTEEGNGWYSIVLSSGDLSFSSSIAFNFAASGCDPCVMTLVKG